MAAVHARCGHYRVCGGHCRPLQWPICRKELHVLLEDKALKGKPLLILANKIDLAPDITEQTLIKELNLDYITQNDWIIIPISAKYGNNLDEAVKYLSKVA